MSDLSRFVCFLIAFVAFVVVAFWGVVRGAGAPASGIPAPATRVNLIAFGLAFFTLPFLWDAGVALSNH